MSVSGHVGEWAHETAPGVATRGTHAPHTQVTWNSWLRNTDTPFCSWALNLVGSHSHRRHVTSATPMFS